MIIHLAPGEPSQIDPLMYDRSYFLEPDGKSPKSYVLLAKTLSETDRVAIVHFALRNKTRLATRLSTEFRRACSATVRDAAAPRPLTFRTQRGSQQPLPVRRSYRR